MVSISFLLAPISFEVVCMCSMVVCPLLATDVLVVCYCCLLLLAYWRSFGCVSVSCWLPWPPDLSPLTFTCHAGLVLVCIHTTWFTFDAYQSSTHLRWPSVFRCFLLAVYWSSLNMSTGVSYVFTGMPLLSICGVLLFCYSSFPCSGLVHFAGVLWLSMCFLLLSSPDVYSCLLVLFGRFHYVCCLFICFLLLSVSCFLLNTDVLLKVYKGLVLAFWRVFLVTYWFVRW